MTDPLKPVGDFARPLTQLMEWFPDLRKAEFRVPPEIPASHELPMEPLPQVEGLAARCPLVHDGDTEGVVHFMEVDGGLWSSHGCDLGCSWKSVVELCQFDRRVPGEDDGVELTTEPVKERSVFARNYRQLTVEELEADPPPFEFILEPYIPSKCVSVLTGPGGSNKTTLLLWLAVCRALGRSMFKGMKVPEEGETVIVTCEDRVSDYRRKLAGFRKHLGAEWNSKAIAERLHFFDLSGELVRFVQAERGEQFRPTALVDEFIVALKRKSPRATYVTVETISRVTGGVENNPAMAALVGAGEQICRQADLTLTYVGHVSQDAARSGRIDAYTARGGSALGDSGRSSIGMAPLLEDKREMYARGLDITAEALERTLVLAHTKTNGVAAAKPMLLYRESTRWGPVLVEPSFSRAEGDEDTGPKKRGRKADRSYAETRAAILDYVKRAKKPVSGNAVIHDLGGNRTNNRTAIADLLTERLLGRDAESRLVLPSLGLNTGSQLPGNSDSTVAGPVGPNPSLPLRSRGEREGISDSPTGSSSSSDPGNRTQPKKGEPF